MRRFGGHIGGILLVLSWVVTTDIAFAQAPDTERRVALVIGNAAYAHIDRLANAGNDATLIADTLQHLGFTVIGGGARRDLDKPHFEQLVQEFGRQIQGADVALFYYAGHGVQVQGNNWLLPVDANPTRLQDIDFQMVDAGLVLKQMDGAGTRLNLLILDACRNNPFANLGTRGVTGGLAQMRAPEGTLISFATQPGNVAADGSGPNGPYAVALAAAMRQPGLDIFRLFNQVGLTVKRETQGAQQPWVSSSPIDGDFFFVAGETASETTVTAATLDAPPAQAPQASRDATSQDAVQTLRALADRGQPEAETDLALLLVRGAGGVKDYPAALQLFERSAAQGDARGQYYAGVMHERGYGVTRSYPAAFDWYRRAAEQNYASAQSALARFYGNGIGVARDPAERNKWLLRAAAQDNPQAENALGNIYRRGLDVPKDPAAAADWYQRAAKHDYAAAQVQLALMYEHANGVPRDYVQALQLLRKAAARQNAVARNAIGAFYLHGLGVPRDPVQASVWFRLAAEQGNPPAKFNLGLLYLDGVGVPRDRAEGSRWLTQAAADGYEPAIARLARMQSRGAAPPSPH